MKWMEIYSSLSSACTGSPLFVAYAGSRFEAYTALKFDVRS